MHLLPQVLYGPEINYASQSSGKLEVGILANAVLEQNSTVLGSKPLPVYYQLGGNRINPVDMFCTLKKAIEMNLSGEDMIEPSIGKGRLVCMDHINTTNDWGKSWVVFPENIDVSNILRLAKLQTWTFKPDLY